MDTLTTLLIIVPLILIAAAPALPEIPGAIRDLWRDRRTAR